MAPPLDLLLGWRSSRLTWGLFLSLAFCVAGCAFLLRILAGYYGVLLWLDLPFLVVLAFVLLAQLRLIDDLADRDYDRLHHPDRILVQPKVDLKPFYAILAMLTFMSLGLTGGLVSARALGVLILLEILMVAIYVLSRRRRWPRLLHAHAVLLKYPGCIFCLAGAPSEIGAAGAGLLAGRYLLASAGELGHDAALRRLPGGRAVLAGVLLLIAALGLWFVFRVLEAKP